MAKLRGSDKISRVVRFLLGLRSRPVAEAMAAAGLHDSDIAEAWALFPPLSRRRIEQLKPDPGLRNRAEVSAWLSRWRPIVLATLGRHAPERRAELEAALEAIPKGGDYETVLVHVLLTRIEGLTSTGDGGALRTILTKRGLTSEVLEEGRRLGDRVRTLPSRERDEEDDATFEQAERALWSWYLEWSAIARAAIRERGLRRALGFSPRGDDDS